MESINHTPGDWKLEFGSDWNELSGESHSYLIGIIDISGSRIISIDDDYDNYAENMKLMVLATHAPHDCNVEDCPGAENKRQLDSMTGLINLLRMSKEDLEGAKPRLALFDELVGACRQAKREIIQGSLVEGARILNGVIDKAKEMNNGI